MKWIVIMLVLPILLVGARPIEVEPRGDQPVVNFGIPINTKIDSATMALKEFMEAQP